MGSVIMHNVVSVDGLPAEHDQRRAPATYDRILAHIAGHRVTVHCTVTRQQVRREGYLEEFLRFWQDNADTRMIWVSLYTPQRGEISAERLTAADREQVIQDLRRLRPIAPKLEMFDGALDAYARPPASPAECAFARTTECVCRRQFSRSSARCRVSRPWSSSSAMSSTMRM